MSPATCVVQRRIVIISDSIDVRTLVQQHLCHLVVPLYTGFVQRRLAPFIDSMDVRSSPKQTAHVVHSSIIRRIEQLIAQRRHDSSSISPTLSAGMEMGTQRDELGFVLSRC
mmetsp:Transcript_20668/g.42189  ORF Transcript_20668/g.42189 Transcript_20668/m.42189 type:complete len:112 (+) Transcript_20668:691-1026(+)